MSLPGGGGGRGVIPGKSIEILGVCDVAPPSWNHTLVYVEAWETPHHWIFSAEGRVYGKWEFLICVTVLTKARYDFLY